MKWISKRKKQGRQKRGCCCLFTLIVLASILACAALFVLLYHAYAQGEEKSQTGGRPLDVVLVLDHSNSMWELGGVGSDPDLLRVDAADLFISYLGVDTGTAGHRLAVVHFGTEAGLVVPLTPLEGAAQRAAVRQVISDPQRMGWTDPLAALTLAYDELFDSPRADPAHRPAVVLLSDGKPERSTDPDPGEKAAYLADLRAMVDLFAGRDCPVFTVALANAATDADPDIQTVYRNLWQEMAARTPPASYHEARAPEDLLRVYHDVVARLSGVEVKPPVIETEVTGTTTYRVPVEEGLARLTLVILKTEPAVRATVVRPSGLALRGDDPDVGYAGQPGQSREEVWAVTMPRPGDWMVELDGQGHVIVWKDVAPLPAATPMPVYAFDLLAPAAYVPDDAPLLVAAGLRDETGERLRDPALQTTVELRRAGFPEATLLARDDGTEGDKVAADTLRLPFHVLPPPTPAVSPSTTLRVETPVMGTTETPTPVAIPTPLPTPGPKPSPRWSLWPWALAAGGLKVIVMLGAGYWALRRRAPRLEGQLRVLDAPADQPLGHVLDLPSHHRQVALGGDGLPLPDDPGQAAPLATLRAVRDEEGQVQVLLSPASAGPESQGPVVTINDLPLPLPHALQDGDVIAVGGWRLRYENLEQAAHRLTHRAPCHHQLAEGGSAHRTAADFLDVEGRHLDVNAYL